MESELVQALTANIEVAAAEVQHAAVVLCWILGPLTVVTAVMGIVCGVAATKADDEGGAFIATGIVCALVFLGALPAFIFELSAAMAPHAYILTHLIRTGS